MTQEEKAKAYDEALKVLHKYDGVNIMFSQSLKEEMFPELKESEDERIRKALIHYMKDYSDGTGLIHAAYGVSRNDAIAWLEKQGEHARFREAIQVGDKVTRNEDGVLVNLSQLKRVAKPAEKQGKQNPVELQQDMLSQEKYAKAVDECIYGEQKSADKVESKFKIGDWVVYDHRPYQVVELPKEGYINLGLIGNGKIVYAPSTYCRYWTIQDVKAGDVLSYRDDQWIFIYKGIVTEDTFKYYALLSEKGITVNDAAFSHLTSCIIPATKEQRDKLEKAMADAGYTFDFEKKELKKIEQKPAEDVDLPEFESHLCLMFQKFRTKGMYTNGEIIDYVKEHSQKLRDILIKPAWSEEDEYCLNGAIETELYMLDVVNGVKKFDVGNNSIKEECTKELNWLKSLKDRYTWKPSDEQMKALNAINATGGISYVGQGQELINLFNDLKKLKE